MPAPTIGPVPAPVSPPSADSTYSASTCDELGWGNAGNFGDSMVCGESDLGLPGGCSDELTWDEARGFCESAGARLCTWPELLNDEARSTGCQVDAKLVWTSTSCGSGSYLQERGASSAGPDNLCVSKTQMQFTRCCADVEVTAPVPAPVSPPTGADSDADTVVQFSSNNVNECPTGFSKPATMSECRAAMDYAGINGEDFDSIEDVSDWPSGCYEYDSTTWFNVHPTGIARADSRLYCIKSFDVTPDVLHVGDSDMDYWATSSLYSSLGKTTQNVGVGGYTCKQVLDEIDMLLADFSNPEWLVVVCGENDLAGGTSVDTTLNRFTDLVAKASAVGARVLYMGTKNEPSTSDLWAEYGQVMREFDKTFCFFLTYVWSTIIQV